MNPPASRLRGLLRDLTDGLAQQMFFWGRDVAHPEGNGLVRAGLQRIARVETGGEGTSRYRIEREHGWIELHGFCAGWRPHDPAVPGMLFVRRCHRIYLAHGEMTPGRYDMSRLRGGTVDVMLCACGPLLRWWLDYEAWASNEFGPAWREAAWRDYRKLRGVRAWLPPDAARSWLRDFTSDPGMTKRPREILRASPDQPRAENEPSRRNSKLQAGQKPLPSGVPWHVSPSSCRSPEPSPFSRCGSDSVPTRGGHA